MAKEKFILVNLKEEETKKLAQVVSNDTSRKILDYLADKEATESELAEKLKIPISTVHYNLQALVQAKLAEAEEFHYSEKGKEVLHYKLANKYIIIAPKTTYGIKEKLRSILPAFGLVALGTLVIFFTELFHKYVEGSFHMAQQELAKGVARAPALAEEAMMDASNIATKTPLDAGFWEWALGQGFWSRFMHSYAAWFLFGCVSILLLILLVEFIYYKRKK